MVVEKKGRERERKGNDTIIWGNQRKEKEKEGKIVINGDSVAFQNPEGTGYRERRRRNRREILFVHARVCVCW